MSPVRRLTRCSMPSLSATLRSTALSLRPNDQRMKDIVQMAKDLHADGIVDVALQFCTLYEMESFAVEKAAEEAGIPFMHITTDYAGEDAGQLQTRIEAFLETI